MRSLTHKDAQKWFRLYLDLWGYALIPFEAKHFNFSVSYLTGIKRPSELVERR